MRLVDLDVVLNTMIDTLLKQRPNFKQPDIWNELALRKGNYIVMTLHRPANVDEEHTLKNLVNEIMDHSQDCPGQGQIHQRQQLAVKGENEKPATILPILSVGKQPL